MRTKNNFALTTPVLFIVFNRLDTTKQVFEEIKKAKPQKLFIAADGPRNFQEKNKTDVVRKYILENINWKCEVKTLFREKNLGCKYAVAGAIDWFFENVEQGIILEDDCLPSQSFFIFCQDMLERYKTDQRIMHISGTNVESISKIYQDYFFAINFNVWGWATWKRAWKLYDINVTNWPRFLKEKRSKDFALGFCNKYLLERQFNKMYNKKQDTWDYQWWFSCITNSGLAIISKRNLITNIGLLHGTHMGSSDKNKMLKRCDLNFPLENNVFVMNTSSYQKSSNRFFRQGFLRRQLKKYGKI